MTSCEMNPIAVRAANSKPSPIASVRIDSSGDSPAAVTRLRPERNPTHSILPTRYSIGG